MSCFGWPVRSSRFAHARATSRAAAVLRWVGAVHRSVRSRVRRRLAWIARGFTNVLRHCLRPRAAGAREDQILQRHLEGLFGGKAVIGILLWGLKSLEKLIYKDG